MNLYLDYLYASLNLYGILSFNDFEEVFRFYNKQFDSNTFIKALEFALAEDLISVNFEKQLLSVNYYDLTNQNDLNFILDIKEEQINYSYYLPKAEIFLKYSDFLYIEEKASFQNLKDFIISEKIASNDLNLDEIIDSYYFSDGLIREEQEYLSYLDSLGFNFSDINQINDFFELLDLTTLDKRLYILRGHTPNEIFDMENN